METLCLLFNLAVSAVNIAKWIRAKPLFAHRNQLPR